VAKWYRETFDEDPNQRKQKINGRPCNVNCYTTEHKTPIMGIVKSYIDENGYARQI
jgi:hypothetical protein